MPAKMMRPGDSWDCTNSACEAEISVQTASQADGVNPRVWLRNEKEIQFTGIPLFGFAPSAR